MADLSNKNSALHGLWVIARKEIIDNFRDRRTLTTLAVSIILSPLIMLGISLVIENKIKTETDPVSAPAFELPVVGKDHAPNLMAWLAQQNITVRAAQDNYSQRLNAGELRVVMVIEPRFAENFSKGKTAAVKLVHDSAVSGLEKIGMNRVENALRAYSRQIGALRLQSRGVDPATINPIRINISDIARPDARYTQFIGMLPYLIILMIMLGGMYLAIDSTAGEREKGSLESLLTLPVKRGHIVIAKLLATAFFSGLTFFLAMAGFALSVSYAPLESIDLVITPAQVVFVFFTCLPFVLVASALLVLVASFTKSYKEAQSYLGFIMLIPSLPLMLLMFLSPEASASNMWIPSFSQALIIIETFKGESIPASLIALSMLSSFGVALVLSWAAVSLYKRERILG